MTIGFALGVLLVVAGVSQVILADRIALFMSKRDVTELGDPGRRAAANQRGSLYRFTGVGLIFIGAVAVVVSALGSM